MSRPTITQTYTHLRIPRSKIESAHAAVLAVSPGCRGETFDQSCLLGWWGFQTTTAPNGDITNLMFIRDTEDDMGILFNALAPFVDEPGIMDFYDTRGNHWRWVLKDGKATRWLGRVLYMDPNPNGQL